MLGCLVGARVLGPVYPEGVYELGEGCCPLPWLEGIFDICFGLGWSNRVFFVRRWVRCVRTRHPRRGLLGALWGWQRFKWFRSLESEAAGLDLSDG